MRKNILLFDIDYTLFDTHRYKKNTAEYVCFQFRIDKTNMKAFDTQYRAQTHTPFGINMKDYTEKMGKHFLIPSEKLFQLLIDTKELFIDTLYSDTLPSLTLLSKRYTLGIFSQGHLSFQRNKLIKTDILSLLTEEYIYIFPHKIHEENILKLPKNAIVIDDKRTVIDTVTKHVPAIHINRDKPYSQPTDLSIRSLTELPEALKNIHL